MFKNFFHVVTENICLIKYFLSSSYRSFAQNGEDLLLNKYFQGVKSGFYVDIGSNHPIILNNTYFFYRRGWRGITIEPNKQFNYLYKLFRPKDIHINEFVSDKEEYCYYYYFKEHVFNCLSENNLESKEIIHKIKVKTVPFDKVVNPFLEKIESFNLLSIDIEDKSSCILNTLIKLIRLPEVILIEFDYFTIDDILNSQENRLLQDLGYELFSVVFKNLFYKKTK
ncbi:MAG: FkbM family methyltransferase [Bacteroidales bacterium]|nr:FkbM family methyltransferase [Bacteroidales bacterium]